MKQFKTYTAPQAELIEMEAQSVFCTSDSPTPTPSPTNPSGGGFQFGTQNGQW